MKKYMQIGLFSLKQQTVFKFNYFYSLISLVIHIFVFNELWDFILNGKSMNGYTKPMLVWYIIVGEIVMYSVRSLHEKISNAVKNGDIALWLIKPMDTISYIIAGESDKIITLLVNIVAGTTLGLIMVGPIDVNLWAIPVTLLSICISFALQTLIQVFIGLLAFYTGDTKSFNDIVSKLTLILVFTPLDFFPKTIQDILTFLPTTYVTYAPAKLLVSFSFESGIRLVSAQILSLFLLIILCKIVYMKGAKKINVNGG